MKRITKSLALFIPVIVQGVIELGKIVVSLINSPTKDDKKKESNDAN